MLKPILAALSLLALLVSSSAFAEPYPDEVREAFTGECVGAGAPEEVCTCVLLKMEAVITLDQLAASDFDPAQLETWTIECMSEYMPEAE
ncbi:MAG: hypothetical protein RBU37_10520 [Myxococcota bacterium]|jgi:hypothetical protein|nr:hypothetical protein [Myxococcota bacterium]